MKQPLTKIVKRGNDPTGHGYFGAKRGAKLHKGLDLICDAGTEIFSMITGEVTKIGYCYADAPEFRYVEVTNHDHRIRLLYCSPNIVTLGQKVNEGDKIGESQDISTHWGGGMQNHLHVEIYKNTLLTDPEPIIDLLELKKNNNSDLKGLDISIKINGNDII